MNSVNVNRVDLLKIIEENKKKHAALYEEAVQDYKSKALALLDKKKKEFSQVVKQLVEKVENSESPVPLALDVNLVHTTFLSLPENHLHDYERTIKMLEMSTDDKIFLSSTDFDQYVLDNWRWKKSFLESYSSNKNISI